MVMRRLSSSDSISKPFRGAEQKSFGKSVIAIGMGVAALGSFGIATFAAGKWEAPPPPPPPPPPTSSSNKNNSSRSYGTSSNKNNSSRSYDNPLLPVRMVVVRNRFKDSGNRRRSGSLRLSRFQIQNLSAKRTSCSVWCNDGRWWTESCDGRWYIRFPDCSGLSLFEFGAFCDRDRASRLSRPRKCV